MNFWKCYAYSFKLPILYKKNSLNFVQICSYQIVGVQNINGKKKVLNSDSCIYERRCTYFKRASNEFEKILKIKDNVPTDYNLIYRAPYHLYLKAAKLTVLCSIGVFSFIFANKYVLYGSIGDVYLGNMLLSDTDFNIFLVSFILFNTAISLFVSKCPLRIYANEDGRYKSIFIGFLPWNLRALSFTKGEVEKVEPFLTILPWSDSYFKIKTKKTILSIYNFRKPSDLYDMLKCQDT